MNFIEGYVPPTDEELRKILNAFKLHPKNTKDTSEIQVKLDGDTVVCLEAQAKKFGVSEEELLIAIITHQFTK